MVLASICLAAMIGQSSGAVRIDLTFPIGPSPKVFTKGWSFGAKASGPGGIDLSKSVRWSGTGAFAPAVGSVSKPVFSKAGANTIVLTVNYKGKRTTRSFAVAAVDSKQFARVGTFALCPADAHGCPLCPHAVQGPIATGSADVLIDGKPAARVGDGGRHASCCGPNEFTIVEGDPQVLIHGRRAARIGSKTQHCGGTGKLAAAPTPLRLQASGWRLLRTDIYPVSLPESVQSVRYRLQISRGAASASWVRSDDTSIRTSLRVMWTDIPGRLTPGESISVTFRPQDAGSSPGAGGFLGCGILVLFAVRDGAPWEVRGQSPVAYAELGRPMAPLTVKFAVPSGKKGTVLVVQTGVVSAILGDCGINYVYAFEE